MAKVISVILVAALVLAVAYYFYSQSQDRPANDGGMHSANIIDVAPGPTKPVQAKPAVVPVLQTAPTMSRAQAEQVLAEIAADLEAVEARVKTLAGAASVAEYTQFAQAEVEPVFHKYLAAKVALEASAAQ